MPEDTRQPLLSEAQVRLAFIGSGVGMVALLVLMLVLATAKPQGDFSPADTTQYEASLARATADLDGYRLLGNDRATIDIRHAIDLVAERGVDLSITSASAAGAASTMNDASTSASASDASASSASSASTSDAATSTPASDAGSQPSAQASGPLRTFDTALGDQTYANCVACHQATGEGIPAVFPPLAGHLPDVFNAENGKAYLANVLLYGLQGAISVEGQTYNGVMPPWSQLSDEQIASVLNHELTEWNNAGLLSQDLDLFTADDIAAQRGAGRSAADVYALRQELNLP